MDGLLASGNGDAGVMSPSGDALVAYDPTCDSACCTPGVGYLEAKVCDGVTPLSRRVFVAATELCYTWQTIPNPHPCYTVYPGVSRSFTAAEVAAVNGLIEVPPTNSQGQTCCACHPGGGDTGCVVSTGTWVPIWNCPEPRPPDQPWTCCASTWHRVDHTQSRSFHKRTVSQPVSQFPGSPLAIITTTDDFSAQGTSTLETDSDGNLIVSTPLFMHGSRTVTNDTPWNPSSSTFPITFGGQNDDTSASGYPYGPDECNTSFSGVDSAGSTIVDSRTVVRDWSCAGYTFTITVVHNSSNPNGSTSEQVQVDVYSAAFTYLGPPCGSGGCTGPNGGGPGGASGGLQISPPVISRQPIESGRLPDGTAAALLFLRG